MSLSYSPAAEATQIAAEVLYPPPPWTLHGVWLWSVYPLRRSAVASLLPAPLQPLWLPTDRTLGWSLIGQYGAGSTLQYQEAGCGLVLHAGPRPAIWIGGLAVDLPESVSGGRNIWGLPKQLARITWSSAERPRASADQHGALLLSFEGVPRQVRSLPLRSSIDVLGVRDGHVKRFAATFDGQLGITRKLHPFLPRSGAWSAFAVSGYSVSGLARGVATFGSPEDA